MKKMSEIKKQFAKVKELILEYDMLDAMLKSMIKAKESSKKGELDFNEEYYNRVVNRVEKIKVEVNTFFKFQ